MRSLYSFKRQKGFTIVELLIVIVVIGILATLVIVTFSGIQQRARDTQRQTDINAVQGHLEAFYATYGYYPTLEDITDGTFQDTYLEGLDPEALDAPDGAVIAAVAPTNGYSYVAAGAAACVNTTASDPTGADTTNNGCDSYTLTADLERGANYVKTSN